MALNRFVAVMLICVVVVGCLILSLNPLSVLVFEIACETNPIIVARELQDIDFTWNITCRSSSIPTYQLVTQPYSVVDGSNKLSFIDLQLNFTLDITIFNGTSENQSDLWRSYHLVFSSVVDRRIQLFCERQSNVVLGDVATVVLDAKLIVWYVGQAPYIDKTIHKSFVVSIPTS